jgi:hypothetical protein
MDPQELGFSSDSFSDEDSDQEDLDTRRENALQDETAILHEAVFLYLAMRGHFKSMSGRNKRDRKGNVKRDRQHHLDFIETWSDDLFKRQFRLCREDFNTVLGKMIQYLGGEEEVKRREEYGRRSSGSPILLKTKLMVTLRLLAGASYLDMIWYGISEESIHSVFKETIAILDASIVDSKIPRTEEEWKELSDGWSAKSVAAKGGDLLPGTTLAGDGLAIPIRLPPEKERKNIEAKKFMNRKGFFALIAQAFCDSNAKFRFFEVSWPGSTNDITCYKQCELFTDHVMENKLPSWVHFVLDEAYSSIGGAHHLCPFSKAQLKKARCTPNVGKEMYEKMRATSGTRWQQGQRRT